MRYQPLWSFVLLLRCRSDDLELSLSEPSRKWERQLNRKMLPTGQHVSYLSALTCITFVLRPVFVMLLEIASQKNGFFLLASITGFAHTATDCFLGQIAK